MMMMMIQFCRIRSGWMITLLSLFARSPADFTFDYYSRTLFLYSCNHGKLFSSSLYTQTHIVVFLYCVSLFSPADSCSLLSPSMAMPFLLPLVCSAEPAKTKRTRVGFFLSLPALSSSSFHFHKSGSHVLEIIRPNKSLPSNLSISIERRKAEKREERKKEHSNGKVSFIHQLI